MRLKGLRLLALAVLTVVSSALTLHADSASAVQETRRHFTLALPNGGVIYEATEIIQIGDEDEANIIIVDDVDGGRFILERTKSYPNHTVSYAILDAKRKAFVRTSWTTPFTSKTRLETLAEAKRTPSLRQVPAVVTVATNGGEWTSLDPDLGEWSTLRHLRHQIRPTVDFSLLEAMERMRGAIFAIPSGDIFSRLVANYVLYESRDEQKLAVKEHDEPPACDFDKSFGYPCSEKQLSRIKERAAKGETRTRY